MRTGAGVARVEGVGPLDLSQLHEVLGHADVTITQVLDLRMRRRVDAYEHPEVVKDHCAAATPHQDPRRPRHPSRRPRPAPPG